MSLFDQIASSSKAAQDGLYGEDIRIVPVVRSNPNASAGKLDTERGQWSHRGRFYTPQETVDIDNRRRILAGGMENQAMHARSKISVTIDDCPIPLKNKDQIYRKEKSCWFTIVGVEADGTGSLICHLVAAKSGPEGS